MMETLIREMPRREGRILDVACGLGATTKYLTRYWRPEDVVGINITDAQLSVCRRAAPGCQFIAMDATRLRFPDESFGNMICVEGAQHFRTRDDFLREALRVLEPGGTLAMSDILLKEALADDVMFPPENYLASAGQYESLMLRIGFSTASLVDITDSGWKSYARFKIGTVHDQWLAGEMRLSQLQTSLASVYTSEEKFAKNLIVVGRK
jgi:ubiquinone/menaquinone biosynthesis C-methylase UbiE